MQLRIPGPTPCPPRVLEAMRRQMINHRGKDFATLLYQITERVKEFFFTKNDLFLLTCSGTGGLEAAIVNTLSPGDKVLALSNGFFGDRFSEIAQAYGAEVIKLEFPWGEALSPDEVKKALSQDPGIKAVILVHNETSTGITNPLAEISKIVREYDKLLLVDAVSSLGSLEFRTDEWGIDVAVTASQKGWMAPPGIAMVSFSQRAWQAHKEARMPRYYFDFTLARKFYEKGQTPWTPAISTLYALASSLEIMAEEGIFNIWQRHKEVGKKTREGIKSLGLSLFAPEEFASNTVTAVKADNLNTKRLLEWLREERNIILAGGQDKLEGKIFRIGHLGWITTEDIDILLKGIEEALPYAGFVPKLRYA